MVTRNWSWKARRALLSAAKQKLEGDVIFACTEGQLLNWL